MSKAAKGIARVIDEVDVIVTSPLARTADTALIAAKALGAESRIQVCQELLPGAPPKNVLTYLGKYKKLGSILLVGHAEELSSLIAALLKLPETVVHLKKGGLCCLEISSLSAQRTASLLWLLTQKQLRALAK
jgi:phosphohistidine phosphatase